MTRSDVSAVVLLVAAGGAIGLGVVGYPRMTTRRGEVDFLYEAAWLEGHATTLAGLAVFAAACLCTAAVLWARGSGQQAP